MVTKGKLLLCFASFCWVAAFTGCASYWLLDERIEGKENGCVQKLSLYPIQPTEVRVTNADGRKLLGCLFSQQDDRGTVLVAGGNAMSLAKAVHYNHFLLLKGFRVLVYSYQGYMQNEGSKSIRSLVSDAMAFYAHIKTSFPAEAVVLAGESISGATAFCLAANLQKPPAIMVEAMINPKTIGYDLANEYWPLFFVSFPIAFTIAVDVPPTLDARRCAGALSSASNPPPVLFVHGLDDKLAPFSATKQIFDDYQGPKRLITSHCTSGAKCHLNLYADKDSRNALVEFAKTSLSHTHGGRE